MMVVFLWLCCYDFLCCCGCIVMIVLSVWLCVVGVVVLFTVVA